MHLAETTAPRPNWRRARLGDVLPLQYGRGLTEKQRQLGSVAVYGSAGQVGLHNVALVTEPSIVVGRKGSAGSVHFCDQPSWPIDTAYFTVGTDEIDLRFAFYLLTFLRLSQLDQSTAIPSLSRDVYSVIEVWLPPVDEQRGIVARIEELFGEIEAGEQELAAAKADLQRYRRAVLKAAVTGELTREWREQNPLSETGAELLARFARTQSKPKKTRIEEAALDQPFAHASLPETWALARLDELAFVQTGNTPPTEETTNYGSDCPFVKPTDLDPGIVTTAREGLSTRGLRLSRHAVPNTVLVTCIGATIGKTGLARMPVAFNQQINGATPTDGVVPEWLYICAISPYGQAAIISNASATTLPILNKSRFSGLLFPCPPMGEQLEASSRVMATLEAIELEAAQIDGLKLASTRLRQSILAAVLSGNLLLKEKHATKEEIA